jgi:hypothetical protein
MSFDPEGESLHAGHARTFLEMTTEAARAQMDDPDDLCLCHGLAGIVETLWHGGRVLDDPDYTLLARQTALACSAAWAERPDALEAAVRSNPSLMVGAAGVLHEMLRMAAPDRVQPGQRPERGQGSDDRDKDAKPKACTRERRPQPTDRPCIRGERIDELRRRDQVFSLFLSRSFLNVLMARCVETFNATMDIPVAADTSFNDFSSIFSMVTARR